MLALQALKQRQNVHVSEDDISTSNPSSAPVMEAGQVVIEMSYTILFFDGAEWLPCGHAAVRVLAIARCVVTGVSCSISFSTLVLFPASEIRLLGQSGD